MHELSLAVSLLRRVEAEVARANIVRVTGITVQVGSLLGVEPELFTDAFKAAAHGTRSASARLDLDTVRAEACCLVCGEVYEPQWTDYQCPACGQAEPEIKAGRDLMLTAVTGEIA